MSSNPIYSHPNYFLCFKFFAIVNGIVEGTSESPIITVVTERIALPSNKRRIRLNSISNSYSCKKNIKKKSKNKFKIFIATYKIFFIANFKKNISKPTALLNVGL